MVFKLGIYAFTRCDFRNTITLKRDTIKCFHLIAERSGAFTKIIYKNQFIDQKMFMSTTEINLIINSFKNFLLFYIFLRFSLVLQAEWPNNFLNINSKDLIRNRMNRSVMVLRKV